MDNTLGKKIAELRADINITQEELASRVGVTRQAISKWERGDGLPDLYNIKSLAKVFDVSVDELINDTKKSRPSDNQFDNSEAGFNGNYIKKLLYKAKHTANSEEAAKIKKQLLKYGTIGLITGIFFILFGFIGFGSGAYNSVNNFSPGNTDVFNPLPYMFLFLFGGVISSISVYVLYGGLGIFVATVTANFLDTRSKCPKCGDEIDADEKVCSSCGYVVERKNLTCDCGKVNQPTDKFCRECGKEL